MHCDGDAWSLMTAAAASFSYMAATNPVPPRDELVKIGLVLLGEGYGWIDFGATSVVD
jgi:hypothetical protein